MRVSSGWSCGLTLVGNLRERMAACGRAGYPQGSSRHWRASREQQPIAILWRLFACWIDEGVV